MVTNLQQLYVEKYVKDENSNWLVLLHGFGGDTRMWKRQVEAFREKNNLLILDLPGHGKSTKGIAELGIRKFEELADMIVDVLKEHKIEKATFVCVSLGTLVFAGILSKHPEVVQGAVLSGAVLGIHAFWRGLLRICNKIRGCVPYMFLMNVLSSILLPFRAHQKSRKFFMKSGKALGRREFMAWFNLLVNDIDALKDVKRLGELKGNLLIVMGKEDHTFIRGVKDKIRSLKGCKLKVLKKCGHVCNIQKWQEFNKIALDFIESMSEQGVERFNSLEKQKQQHINKK